MHKLSNKATPPRFSDEVANQIREEYRSTDVSYRDLVLKYDTCLSTIGKIIKADSPYRHLGSSISKQLAGNFYHKIPDDIVRKIIQDYKDNGLTCKELVRKYDVAYSSIEALIRGLKSYAYFCGHS